MQTTWSYGTRCIIILIVCNYVLLKVLEHFGLLMNLERGLDLF